MAEIKYHFSYITNLNLIGKEVFKFSFYLARMSQKEEAINR